jgi:transcription elongation factor GreB
MSKAFTKETERDDEELEVPEQRIPAGSKNYLTPAGYQTLREELLHLIDVDRPEVVRTVTWAASNGDRSENADYIYGKRRLREIDRRVRFLTKRLDNAEVVDPARQVNTQQVFFGATVTYAVTSGEQKVITIVGIDEASPAHGKVSWISPIARAVLKARVGDVVRLRNPGGSEELEIVAIRYSTQ